MARIASPRSRARPRFEIVPFIDIMFFLLATFLTVSLRMIQNHGIPVNLPSASTAAAQARGNEVVLSVTAQGELLWDRETMAFAALPDRLVSLRRSQPGAHIFINGDTKAAFGRAVEVLDAVRKAGIEQVAIETGPDRESKP